MNELALFAGGGGGLLGSILLGWKPICYVENNEYSVEIIKARIGEGFIPDAPIWGDIRTFNGTPWRGCVDIVTAGFPCQPFSSAGKMLGKEDERNLWPETIRIIREVRPRYAFLENVPTLISSGYYGTVLGDLAESGLDARWDVFSAAASGAPHIRKRVFILAWDVAYSESNGWSDGASQNEGALDREGDSPGNRGKVLADTYRKGQPQSQGIEQEQRRRIGDSGQKMVNPDVQRRKREQARQEKTRRRRTPREDWWQVEPGLGRVADGMADRMDRITALGNGQVPDVVRRAWRVLSEQQ